MADGNSWRKGRPACGLLEKKSSAIDEFTKRNFKTLLARYSLSSLAAALASPVLGPAQAKISSDRAQDSSP